MQLPARWHLFTLILTLLTAKVESTPQGRKHPNNGSSWTFPHHSFEKTLSWDEAQSDWLMSAATIATKEHLLLLPPVPDRSAVLWAKKAIQSRDFEVTFTVSAKAKAKKDAALAFWISLDDFAASFDEKAIISKASDKKDFRAGMAGMGLSYLGNKPNFKGLLLVFLPYGKNREPRQTIAALWHDHDGETSDFDRLFEEEHLRFVNMDWLTPETQIRIRIHFDGTIVGSKLGEGGGQIFSLPHKTMPIDTNKIFIGFTGYSGESDGQEVLLHRLQTRNFDLNVIGEDEADYLEEDTEAWKKALEDEARYVDQASQREAVERLTKLLSKHNEQEGNFISKIYVDLGATSKRVDKLLSDFALYKSATEAWEIDSMQLNPEVVRGQILGIKTILSSSKDAHDTKLQQIHKAALGLKDSGDLGEHEKLKVASATKQAKLVEDYAKAGSRWTNGLLLIIVVCTAILGFLFWNRMRYYEKKHFV